MNSQDQQLEKLKSGCPNHTATGPFKMKVFLGRLYYFFLPPGFYFLMVVTFLMCSRFVFSHLKYQVFFFFLNTFTALLTRAISVSCKQELSDAEPLLLRDQNARGLERHPAFCGTVSWCKEHWYGLQTGHLLLHFSLQTIGLGICPYLQRQQFSAILDIRGDDLQFELKLKTNKIVLKLKTLL